MWTEFQKESATHSMTCTAEVVIRKPAILHTTVSYKTQKLWKCQINAPVASAVQRKRDCSYVLPVSLENNSAMMEDALVTHMHQN
jgi:hypothetical protein